MSVQTRANEDWGRWEAEHGEAAFNMGWRIIWVQANQSWQIAPWTSSAPQMKFRCASIDEAWRAVLLHWHQPYCAAALQFIARHNAPLFLAMAGRKWVWPAAPPEWLKVLLVTAELRI